MTIFTWFVFGGISFTFNYSIFLYAHLLNDLIACKASITFWYDKQILVWWEQEEDEIKIVETDLVQRVPVMCGMCWV